MNVIGSQTKSVIWNEIVVPATVEGQIFRVMADKGYDRKGLTQSQGVEVYTQIHSGLITAITAYMNTTNGGSGFRERSIQAVFSDDIGRRIERQMLDLCGIDLFSRCVSNKLDD